MKKLISFSTGITIVVFSYILIGCSESNFKSSKNNPIQNPPAPWTPAPQPVNPTPEPPTPPKPVEPVDPRVQRIIDHINDVPKTVKVQFILDNLDVDATQGKDVKICLWYNSKGGSHSCDRAVFDVHLNGVKSDKQLNLNNSTSRRVRGISNLEYMVPLGRDDTVPGTLYSSEWQQSSFELNTSCALDSCHNDIAMMAIIGTAVFKDEEGQVEVSLVDENVHITTGQAVRYSLNSSDFKVVGSRPTFGDMCEIK